jgi:hypothetical protein
MTGEIEPTEADVLQTSPRRPVRSGISHRDLRLLQAVADGRVECSGSVEPDFYVDGLACCDHMSARALTRAGLIRPADASAGRIRFAVQLTDDGHAVLNAEDAADIPA